MRRKLPFGIAQVGKAFRNEITPGNFTFRTREFEQMEIEYFVRPGEDEAAHEMWIAERKSWYLKLGMRAENLRVREQEKHELAHYAKRCVDLEYLFPMGWSELEGIANRTDFDLRSHSRSAENPDAVGELKYFDQEQKKHLVPYVIEPSAGADRATLAFLCDAYEDALVKEPPAEETAKLRELVESFARSVGRREGMACRREAAPGRDRRGHRGRSARHPAAPHRPDGGRGRGQHRGHEEGARGRGEDRRGAHPHRAAPPSAAGPADRGRLPAQAQRRPAGRDGPRPQARPAEEPVCAPSTTTPAPSASSTAARTRSERRGALRSISRASTTRPSPCATGTACSRSG